MRECGSGTRAEGSEVERVDKMWSGRWPGLEKGERRVWGHHDTRVVGAERQIKKKVQMRGNGEGVKGTCWAPAPGVGGLFYLPKGDHKPCLYLFYDAQNWIMVRHARKLLGVRRWGKAPKYIHVQTFRKSTANSNSINKKGVQCGCCSNTKPEHP